MTDLPARIPNGLTVLDTYCCAGGMAMGYYLAGFDVVGVDIDPQPNYPFEFHQADAVEFIKEHGHEFDLGHGSPPCQLYTPLNAYNHKVYPDLIGPTREAFEAVGLPFVIENVEAAAPELRDPTLLCGPMFGLRVYRHRLFETNWDLSAPEHPAHVERCTRNGYLPTPEKPFMSIHGGKHSRAWQRAAADAMGMPWIKVPEDARMDRIQLGIREVCEAIPPAYAQWIREAGRRAHPRSAARRSMTTHETGRPCTNQGRPAVPSISSPTPKGSPPVNADPTPETARALLWRHGLPEDVIDGALCLHAQELMAVQRKAVSETDDPVFYEGEAGWLIDLIDPTRDAAPAGGVVSAAPDRADLHQRIAAALYEAEYPGFEWEQAHDEDREQALQRAAAVLPVLPPPADRAAGWLDAAAECNKAGGAYAERGINNAAGAAFALMETFLRKAGEAEYVAMPCSGPVPCEDGGEPCDTHERLMGHAEGEHELCAPDCGDAWLRRLAAEAPQPECSPACSEQHTYKPGCALADETQQQPGTETRVVAYRSPGTRKLYCLICARQETGWQPVTDAAEQAVCDFCGGSVHAVAARTLGDVVARYLPDAPAVSGPRAADDKQDGEQT